MRIARALRGLPVTVAGLVLLLSGCTSEEEPTAASTPPSSDPVVEVDPAPVYGGRSQPVTVAVNGSGTSCFTGRQPPTELAWFDASWQANTDLDDLAFELNGTGLRVGDTAWSVPPFNAEGQIMLGGSSTWPPGEVLRDSRGLLWSQRQWADLITAGERQTGMLVFRVRFDDDVLAGDRAATLDEIEARWTTADGDSGSVLEPVDQTFSFDGADCR